MKRKDVLREFLVCIFNKTTVKPSKGIIATSGDLFSKCRFSHTDFKNYMKLLHIAFMEENPMIYNPNTKGVGGAKQFKQAESISRFFVYLESYGKTINSDKLERKNEFAFTSASSILSAIFVKSNNSNQVDIEEEDISIAFRNALDSINVNPFLPSGDPMFDFYTIKDDYIYDTDYDKSSCNYSIPVNVTTQVLYPIKVRILIDKNRKYDVNAPFFLKLAVGSFHCLHGASENILGEAFYIEKPISFFNINSLPMSFLFATYLDEETIINYDSTYDCRQLIKIIERKANSQRINMLRETTYFADLENYSTDIIKRILGLDLKWLYGDDEKTLDKCKEEIEKIIVCYNELYTYFDSCDETVAVRQYLTILHHAIVEVTNYLNENMDFIASCVANNECSDHIKYIKGIINGTKYKEFVVFSEGAVDNETNEPECLGEIYYYTSSNELSQLLQAIRGYYEALKKSRKIS